MTGRPAGTTHYVWDIFGNIIAEANGLTGATLREMVYLEGMPLSAIDVAASPKKIYAVHVDHLNRPVMLTDAAKATVWAATYEPFGRVHSVTGTVTQNLGLPGQWFQLEDGLAYNWHRHYDPTTGRCTTADPLGFVDGPSAFAYAGNKPQRMVDPSGLDASYFSQITGAGSDFLRNYSDMRSANTIGADRYFHCKANCEASQRGDARMEVARILSNGREFLDQCFGGSQDASSADQFANLIGRVHGSMSGRSCRNLCSAFRPRMLNSSY